MIVKLVHKGGSENGGLEWYCRDHAENGNLRPKCPCKIGDCKCKKIERAVEEAKQRKNWIDTKGI